MVDPPHKEIIFQEPVNLFSVNGVQCNLQSSFDFTLPAAELQVPVAPQIAADPIIHEQEIYILPEADFLEMDDLLGPEPAQGTVEEALHNVQVEEADGLSELDRYHDAAMFWNDIGPGTNEIIDQYEYYLDSNPFGLCEDVDQPYVEGESPTVNQIFLNDANQVNYQFQSDSAPHEQEGSVLTSAEFYPGSNSDQTSGI